jgi:solute:Na+ symporter, SSS family
MHDTTLRALSGWDHLVLVVFFVFMASIGWVFRRSGRDSSEYFRGGGNMLWWMAGMSALMGGISTYSFTGGAAKCYNDGFLLPLTWWLSIPGTMLVSLYVAGRFRRMRVTTAMEAVHRRFGTGTEQFYTWISLALGIFFGGVMLNTLAIFMASAFRTDVALTIVAIGTVIGFTATLGGQWGMAASAFVQGLIMFLIVLVLVFRSVTMPELGGLSNLWNPGQLLAALPDRHLNFEIGARLNLVVGWIGMSVLFSFLTPLDLRNAARFITVKDEHHARRTVLLACLPSLLGITILMQLPSMCAAVVLPDLHAVFPDLKSPEEAAYVAIALKVLPQGLMGLMLCGMFAASMDVPVNQYAGFLIRNFYLRFIRPDASEERQVALGRAASVGLTVVIVGAALSVNAFRTLNLFDFFQIFNALVMSAIGVPMILGILIRRTPPWSGWSTVLVGMSIATAAKALYSPEAAQQWLGYTTPLTPREVVDSQTLFISLSSFIGASLWFLATRFFYNHAHTPFHAQVDSLFADFQRPIDRAHGEGEDEDIMQYREVGRLCRLLGGLLLAGALIPNPLGGRLGFIFIGGVILSLGLWFRAIEQRKIQQQKGNHS